jgi:aminopeptidase-like protein
MKKIIEDLFKFDRQLLGNGYDKALDYIDKIIPLKIYEFPSGTNFTDWVVPKEWIMKDAWIKFNGEKIIDIKNNPLHLVQYSSPFSGKITREELLKHLYFSEERPDDIPYEFSFYQEKWGFCVPKTFIYEKIPNTCVGGDCHPELKDIDPEVGKISIEGLDGKDKWGEIILQEGEYEICVDTEFKDGIMKIGEYTIQGKSNKEIILIAHLDHPYQAEDNLSGVACLIKLAQELKNTEHTIKIVFCPETIGSIAYVNTVDQSNVDYVISVDCVGNNNDIYWQKSWNEEAKINYYAHLALTNKGIDYKKSLFRSKLGSDEYVYNDPELGINGILISRFINKKDSPYEEYHTSADTPEIINYEKIEQVCNIIKDIISISEKDYIPKRTTINPLFKSKYGLWINNKQYNLQTDYLWYSIDGKKYLSELVSVFGLNFDYIYDKFEELIKNNLLQKHGNSGANAGKKRKQKVAK